MNIDASSTHVRPIIAVAGATGDLGARIVAALVSQGASVRALLRTGASGTDHDRVVGMGAEPFAADPSDVAEMTDAIQGSACVLSALNGLREVILDRQSVLLDAAVAAGVPRFIPSDYCADFTRTTPGGNRNLDLRREFYGRADRASIAVTSVLNGAFMDMLGHEMPIIQPKIRRVLYWGSADQPMYFTTKDDVAAFTAAAALDPSAPRVLRVAGSTVSVQELADILGDVTDTAYRPLKAGNVRSLGAMIGIGKVLSRDKSEVFPAWQGMQYMRDMFAGDAQLDPLNNDRYADIAFGSARDHFTSDPVFAPRS